MNPYVMCVLNTMDIMVKMPFEFSVVDKNSATLLFITCIDYSIGPLVGVPMNYTLSTSDTVATNVSCPVFSRDYGCRFTVGDTCENRGGFVLLTCRESKKCYFCTYSSSFLYF